MLFVAFEPWETRLGRAVLEQREWEASSEASALLVADPYQIRNRRASERLTRDEAQTSFPFHKVFEDLADWQSELARVSFLEARGALERQKKRSSLQDIELLIDTDVILNPCERSPYYYPLSKAQKLMLLAKIVGKTLDFVEPFAPDEIWMIGDNYLVKNFLGMYAESHSLKIRVVRQARIGNFLKVDDFFLPKFGATSSVPQSPARDESKILKEYFSPSEEKALYEGSPVGKDKRALRSAKAQPLRFSVAELFRGIAEQRRQMGRSRETRVTSLQKARIYASSSWRVRVYLANRRLRMMRYAFSGLFVTQYPTREQYFLYPLHLRPESSVLSQNDGLSEEDAIGEISRVLQSLGSGKICAVLENPSMVADRRRAFYRKVGRLPGVILLDPALNTRQLIRDSLGVICLAGSVAIEGSLLGKPVHVLGKPDFLPAIRSFGLERLSTFLRDAGVSGALVSSHQVVSYLDHILKQDARADLGWTAVSSDAKIAQVAHTLLSLFEQSGEKIKP